MKKKEYAVTLIQTILEYPSVVIPQLEDVELLAVLDDALHLYRDRELSLDTLTNFAKTMQTFIGIRKININGLLKEICAVEYFPHEDF